MFHEHQRQDRDNYVEILSENVRAGAEGNFIKIPEAYINNRGVPYDVASSMHYRAGVSKNVHQNRVMNLKSGLRYIILSSIFMDELSECESESSPLT